MPPVKENEHQNRFSYIFFNSNGDRHIFTWYLGYTTMILDEIERICRDQNYELSRRDQVKMIRYVEKEFLKEIEQL